MREKRFLSILLAIVFILTMAAPAFAAANVQSVTITGNKTVYVGNTVELDSHISPGYLDLNDSEYTWSSSNSSVAKVLVKHDEDTKVKGVKAGTATITVKINGTNIKATYKVTVKKAKVSTASARKKIQKYKKSAKKIKRDIKKAVLANTYTARRTQYYNYVGRINSVERKLERLENTWERKYERGKISYSKYRTIERKAERVENYLDDVEDYLERKFLYEFDD